MPHALLALALSTKDILIICAGAVLLLIGVRLALSKQNKTRFIGLAISLIGFVILLTGLFAGMVIS